MKKDNSTIRQKIGLRNLALSWLEAKPVILETHGGRGEIYKRLYRKHGAGIVLETDKDKLLCLSRQRPEWRVYGCRAETGLLFPVDYGLQVNFIDCDPYGSPWDVLQAWFSANRQRANQLVIVVNDGIKQKLLIGAASVRAMKEENLTYGNKGVAENYLTVCKDKLKKMAAPVGYSIANWHAYYCGTGNHMTHYAVDLRQR